MEEEYEEDNDFYLYKNLFASTHLKCPVCGTIGYYSGICVVCDFPDYETEFE